MHTYTYTLIYLVTLNMLISMLFARQFEDARKALRSVSDAYRARHQVDRAYFRRAFEAYLDR